MGNMICPCSTLLERSPFSDPTWPEERLWTLLYPQQILPTIFRTGRFCQTLGSDHLGILFTVHGTSQELVGAPAQKRRFNTKLTDWKLFTGTLQATTTLTMAMDMPAPTRDESLAIIEGRSYHLPPTLDNAASELTQTILGAAQASIPQIRPGAQPKPWLSPHLKNLRKDMLRKQRDFIRFPGPGDPRQDSHFSAKNTSFQQSSHLSQIGLSHCTHLTPGSPYSLPSHPAHD